MTEICLETSLLGFCSLNKNILFLKNHGVLIRNDEDFLRHTERVMLISGGGAGHEPGFGGFIGEGMLDAVVCGNVFTSPSVASCLAAILQASDVNREILLVINNYTGDRLNFGLAVEMAKNEHYYQNVRLLIVDDDCSIDNPRHSTGRRGLAGFHLISKIAGAMSVNGARLNDIYDFCDDLLCNRLIRTIGFSFHHDTANELTNIEIGYGIHGEPGSMKIEREKSFKPIIHILKEKLRLIDVNSDVVLLFNNLGGASEFVCQVFIKEFIEGLRVNVLKVYVGKFLTSLSKEAISVTVMEVRNPKIVEYLELPIDTPAGDLFNKSFELCVPKTKYFEIPQPTHMLTITAHITKEIAMVTRNIIEKSCEAAMNEKQYLNNIDSELGDGDTGSTLYRAANAVLNDLKEKRLNVSNPHEMLLQISRVLMDSMGGSSGAIFSIFFQCASTAFTQFNEHTIDNWMNGMSNGINGIMHHGKARIGDRTLLDSLQTGVSAMRKCSKNQKAQKILEAFAEGCQRGAEATKTMSPKSGRSSYSLSDKGPDFEFKSENSDPGAFAVSVLAKALLRAFTESYKE